ncbi:MAG: hypothetical protein AAF438_04800 [Pseudomonadota bacterium]
MTSKPAHQLRLGALLVSGEDTLSFLQGQLSNDVSGIGEDHSLLASISNAKGRVLAVMYLVKHQHGLLLVLPEELTSNIKNHLQHFVFRAKVSISIWQGQVFADRPDSTEAKGVSQIPVDSNLALYISEQQFEAETDASSLWISSGRPWVLATTQEQFVAQMLNLDLMGGIDWNKGCYTGQEIIARTHYLGKHKRRMLQFEAPGQAAVAPGDPIVCGEKTAGTVVNAAKNSDTWLMLAVVRLSFLGEAFALKDGTPISGTTLPYAIPELDDSD